MTLADHGPGGDITARFDPGLVHAMAEAGEVARDTTPAARRLLANALIGHWPSLFGLSETASYITFLRQFLLLLARKPTPANPVAKLGEGKVWNFPGIGEGDIDFARVLQILDQGGYTGPVSVEIEFLGEPWPPLAEVNRAMKASYDRLAALGLS